MLFPADMTLEIEVMKFLKAHDQRIHSVTINFVKKVKQEDPAFMLRMKKLYGMATIEAIDLF